VWNYSSRKQITSHQGTGTVLAAVSLWLVELCKPGTYHPIRPQRNLTDYHITGSFFLLTAQQASSRELAPSSETSKNIPSSLGVTISTRNAYPST
jgi:hypothetical protein